MPQTDVVFYLEESGACPVRQWLADLRKRQARAFAKCVARIHRLAEAGHELRRPEADLLRDGIHELRIRDGNTHYRILYFFDGRSRNVCVLAHALTKEGSVPHADIERALERRQRFETDPAAHTFREA